jgi:enoyl-CoA hydratase/carnithine racemase
MPQMPQISEMPRTFSETAAQRRSDAAAGRWQRLEVTVENGRQTITINRPDRLNCFDYLTLLELADAFHDAERNPAVRVVVLTGAGDRAFCTGADQNEQRTLTIPNPQEYHTWMGAFIEVHERVRAVGKPTIARINGMAVGGGNEFQMMCDLSIMADHGYIRHVGPAHGSVPAGGATQWLAMFVGERRARQIVYLGENIEAARALEWGLVNEVVPMAELDAAVDRMVDKLERVLPETIRYTRVHMDFWKDMSWYQTIRHARDWLTLHTAAPEVREAVSGFVGKRPPDYAGLWKQYGTPEGAFAWGAPENTCPNCGATSLPSGFSHCGNCGVALTSE